MELQRVKEIEDAIARGEMTAAQVFTQMKQLVYRKAPCYALCESNAYENKIRAQTRELDQVRTSIDDIKPMLMDAKAIAMKNTVAARVPECGDFGAIAQDLAYITQQLKLDD